MKTIAVVGLGYVGLPLAVEFGKKYRTIGFDLSASKIEAYRSHVDPTGEVSGDELREASLLHPTCDPQDLNDADFIVVAVPTPVDDAHIPDLSPLVGASTSVGRHLKRGAVVVYESTVYPGATEEVCIPILEKESGLKWKQDFFVGYSPERINPGDKEHTLTRITKVVSGDTPQTLEIVAEMYGSIITAGVHRASSIKVAEAAKVIENTQRDLNIALVNELSLIFHRIGIDTTEVLQAAGTKWNFLPFRPGLVGGHCIGVDPYYLTHKAETHRLPPAGHPRRPAHQRRHGQVRRRADRQGDDPVGLSGEGRARHRARAHLQGELPGPAQFQGDRRDPRAGVLRRDRARARPGGERGRGEARVRRRAGGLGAPATRQRHRGRGGARRIAPSVRWRSAPPSWRQGGLYVDVKCQADAARLREGGFKVWRL